MHKNAIVLETKSRRDHRFISSDLLCLEMMSSHPSRPSQLQPGEAILSLLTLAELLVLTRLCLTPWKQLGKPGICWLLLGHEAPVTAGAETGGPGRALRQTAMEECLGKYNSICPKPEISQPNVLQHWAPPDPVRNHIPRSGSTYRVELEQIK